MTWENRLASLRRTVARAAVLLLVAGGAHADGEPFATTAEPRPLPSFAAPARGLDLRVVELPPSQAPGLGRPRRPHHALSFRNEAPRRWLQSIGVDAVDCTTRVRFPSRLAPSADGSGLAAEVAAQVHFSCRF